MHWVPCVRLELPEGATDREARLAASHLRLLAATLHASPTARLNLAFDGLSLARLRVLAPDVADDLRRFTGLERAEVLATPFDSALLPLLPAHEIERQLLRGEDGVAWLVEGAARRTTMWPTALATSPRVMAAAAHLGYSSMLADEAVIDDRDAREGARLDSVAGHPGLFLFPVARRPRYDAPLVPATMHFRVLVYACGDGTPPPPELLGILARARTVRVCDVFELFSKDHAASPAPSAGHAGSTPDHPFGPWCGSDAALARTRRVASLSSTLQGLDEAGLHALPAVRTARAMLDAATRATRWLEPCSLADLEAAEAALAGAGLRLAAAQEPLAVL